LSRFRKKVKEGGWRDTQKNKVKKGRGSKKKESPVRGEVSGQKKDCGTKVSRERDPKGSTRKKSQKTAENEKTGRGTASRSRKLGLKKGKGCRGRRNKEKKGKAEKYKSRNKGTCLRGRPLLRSNTVVGRSPEEEKSPLWSERGRKIAYDPTCRKETPEKRYKLKRKRSRASGQKRFLSITGFQMEKSNAGNRGGSECLGGGARPKLKKKNQNNKKKWGQGGKGPG